jgi:hypothetical protein
MPSQTSLRSNFDTLATPASPASGVELVATLTSAAIPKSKEVIVYLDLPILEYTMTEMVDIVVVMLVWSKLKPLPRHP